MKLSVLHEATPLTVAIQAGIGKNYFAARKPMVVPNNKPVEGSHPSSGVMSSNAGYGLGGGNYGAQLGPRLQQYFGGLFGR
jgi:hypothetical protein